MEKGKILLTVAVDDAVYEKFREIAKGQGQTMSALVRRFIYQELKKNG